MKGANELGKF